MNDMQGSPEGFSRRSFLEASLIVAGGVQMSTTMRVRQLWLVVLSIHFILTASTLLKANRLVGADPKSANSADPVYLDDLPELPGKVTNGKFYGIHGKTGYPAGIVQQVRVNGVPQSHAISLCAKSDGKVHVEFNINKEFETFRGKAGFLQATADDGLAAVKKIPDWNGRTAKSHRCRHLYASIDTPNSTTL